MLSETLEEVRALARRWAYTWIGGAALAGDFVANPAPLQDWLKKAERRGSKVAATNERRLRPVLRFVDSLLGEVLNLGDEVPEAGGRRARKVARTVRRSTPTVRVSSRNRSTRRGRRTTRRRLTTLSVSTPTRRAS